MAIYTKTGDKGTTAIFGGKRLRKSDIQIAAYGDVDEATSFIGLTIEHLKTPVEKKLLTDIQKSLYKIMAVLSGAGKDPKTGKSLLSNLQEETLLIERVIDAETGKLPPLNRFVLPQGSVVSSLYHVDRAVIRRAERAVDLLISEKNAVANNPQILIMIAYLNRLSDLFFTLARKHAKGKEVVT